MKVEDPLNLGVAVRVVDGVAADVSAAAATEFGALVNVCLVVLLIADRRTGVRGRRAARYVLLAYLLLTLAYPGVKFVTDVVLA